MKPPDKTRLVGAYRKSRQRLILLDYDGTLVPFFERPEKARPGTEILKLLETLAGDPKNEVVLVSGRDKDTLDEWFGVDAGYVAEHGAWIKKKGGEWETVEPLKNDWKEEIRPALKLYVDKTPGSFIEEKEFSIVWHYRGVDQGLGQVRAGELLEDLTTPADFNLQVLEGNKVIEVKNAGIDKGRAASRWIAKKEWDFILAVGDDVTDEDIFGVLPASAYSIKVGQGPSGAKLRLNSPSGVVSLLKEMMEN